MSDCSRDAVLDFLDYLARKGLVKPGTVASRKVAVNALLSILSDDEAKDLRELDIEVLLQRFSNLKGSEFKPESLRVYKSRLVSTLEDFNNYRQNPAGFKPSGIVRDKKAALRDRVKARETKHVVTAVGGQSHEIQTTKVDEFTFPIPLRSGVVVKVTGIPADLTPEEAAKIGKVVLALSGSLKS
jgi:hypothetical protein